MASERSPLLQNEQQPPARTRRTSSTVSDRPILANGPIFNVAPDAETVIDEAVDAGIEEAGGIRGGSGDDGNQEEAVQSNVKLAAILPGLMIGIFFAAMDGTIVVSAYGRIGSELNSLQKTAWIATAYLMTTTAFQPLYGKMSDLTSRKACLIFSYTVFALGSLWCGFSRSMNELIIARAFAGIGGGGMTTVSSILMSDIIPLRKRGTWQGLLNIVYASGAAAGAPLGGMLADSWGWRWAFLFQVPFICLALIFVSIFLNMPAPHNGQDSFRTRFFRIDFLGALTLILAVLSLLVALDRGGNVSWSDPAALATAPTAIVLFVAFWVIERYVAVEPFAPTRIVGERTLLSSYLGNFFGFAAFFAIIFFIPLYFQAVAELSASKSGLRMLPAIVGSVTGSIFGGVTMQKTGKYYWLTVSAYTVSVMGSIPLLISTGLLGPRSYTGIELGLAFVGFGNGIAVTSTLIAMIAKAGPEDQAVATAVSYLFRSLGSVVGLSVSSTVLQAVLRSRLASKLKGKVGDDQIEDIVRRATGSLDFLKNMEPWLRAIVVESYEAAVRYPFVLAIVFGFMAIVSSLFIREVQLRK